MVRFDIPWVPPTDNNAYANKRGGGRILTSAGKKFKNETKAYLVQRYTRELRTFVPNCPYLVYTRFYLDNFFNSTFGKKGGAEFRYKELDVGNRRKLLEDVIKDVAGVDDSHTMILVLEKRPTAGTKERTEVFIWNTMREESPFDELLARI